MEAAGSARKQPWLLHALTVSTLNFCGFSTCHDHTATLANPSSGGNDTSEESQDEANAGNEDSLIIAVPGAQDDQIAIYHLPSEHMVGLIPAPKPQKTKAGMVMALNVMHQSSHPPSQTDSQSSSSGLLVVIAGYESGRACVFIQVPSLNTWQEVYTSTPHSEPVLSLDKSPLLDCFFTSAADGVIAKHPAPPPSSPPDQNEGASAIQDTLKFVQTRHSGQQSLFVRNDGRVFATAGWDARIRIYSTKTLKEVACCKWHRQGCYALAFGDVSGGEHVRASEDGNGSAMANRQQTVAQVREEKTTRTHWMAAGAKDGKVSLWDVF